MAGIAEVVFWMTVSLIKISIVLFNRRLTGLSSARWMVAHSVFLFLLVSYLIIALFTSMFSCRPAAVHYSLIHVGRLNHPLKCFDPNALGIGLSTVHVIFDFALLTVPITVLYRVKMSTSKKFRLGVLFSVGCMSCIASALRQHYQAQHYKDFTCRAFPSLPPRHSLRCPLLPFSPSKAEDPKDPLSHTQHAYITTPTPSRGTPQTMDLDSD